MYPLSKCVLHPGGLTPLPPVRPCPQFSKKPSPLSPDILCEWPLAEFTYKVSSPCEVFKLLAVCILLGLYTSL